MRYTEEELRNCLEERLKWYKEALEYRRKGIMPPFGFPLPDGDINTWEGSVRELKNVLDMINGCSMEKENKVNTNKTIKIYLEVCGGLVSNVYTDSKEDIDIILCDYDIAEGEEEGDGYDFQSTKVCDELEEKMERLRHIF